MKTYATLFCRIKRKLRLLLIPVLVSCLQGCASQPELGPEPLPEGYHQEFNEWNEYRIGVLTEPTGWLRLVDLIWLDEGENSFGSSPEVDIRFPEGTIPPNAGSFLLEDDKVIMRVDDGVTVTHEGEPVQRMVLRDAESRPQVQHEDLIWFIDIRGGRYGIRLFNTDNPRADEFDGFPAYEVNPQWHHRARFIPWEEERAMEIENVLGDTVERTSPGRVEFRVDGELNSLIAFEAANGLFLMFTDRTGRSETFQAGRYLITDPPDEEGYVTLDFNYAYNPPCAFNRFTTCHLPPPENRLDLEIRAGEKRPVDWDGRF